MYLSSSSTPILECWKYCLIGLTKFYIMVDDENINLKTLLKVIVSSVYQKTIIFTLSRRLDNFKKAIFKI